MNEPNHRDMQETLSHMRYPCDRGQLLQHAAAQGADDRLLGRLGSLPDGDFAEFNAVRDALTVERED